MHRSSHRLATVLVTSLACLAVAAPLAVAQTPGTNGALLMLHTLEVGRTVQSSELLLAQPGKVGVQRLPATGGALTGVAWRPDGTSQIGWARTNFQPGSLQTSFRCIRATDCVLPPKDTDDSSIALPGPTASSPTALVSFKANGSSELAVIDAAGARTSLATSTTGDLRAAWLPAATGEILFSTGGEILRTRIDGSATTRLIVTGCPKGVGAVDTSPDGTHVAYTCFGAKVGESALYASRIDGTSYVVLAPMTSDVQDVTWSPDGTTIAFLAATKSGSYLTVPVAGGTAREHRFDHSAPYDSVASLEWQSCTATTKACGAKPDGRCWSDSVDTFSGDEELRIYSIGECRLFPDGHVKRRANGTGETLPGTEKADVIFGGRGADTLLGYAGADTIKGGAGNDTLDGGPGVDTLVGGAGTDIIRARDGKRDTITCGAGRDRVIADRRDAVAASCEAVLRP